jgi:outer membrane receptor protein involved in Fe transport
MREKILILFFLLMAASGFAATIKGKVQDANGEPMTGAHVTIQGISTFAVVGLDGSYLLADIKPGEYQLIFSFIGYVAQQIDVSVKDDSEVVNIKVVLKEDQALLSEVVVMGVSETGSETQARNLERNSSVTLNVVSAKAISLTPDLSVANVVQRVSGLSIERNSSGDPQYAIVRGMDKRYSYTLINGVKIPSPDNKNRYVPLDIFPANLLDRLEVYKSLTADLEGDAMGGGINMVMKGAPESFEIKGDLQTGYNYINLLRNFNSFDASAVNPLSPREEYGDGYLAQPSDFSTGNGVIKSAKPIPDLLASLSIGSRVFNKKLGVMVGGSFQNSYRGTESIWFDTDTDRFGSNLPSIRSVEDRLYSTRQLRNALHTRLDYRIVKGHSINLYVGYYSLVNQEARETKTTFLDGRNFSSSSGNAILSYSTRTRSINQRIFNNTLQGSNQLLKSLSLDWSLVYSKATNDQPDNLRFDRNGELKNFVEQPINVERRAPRQWQRNTDTDYTAYYNLTWQPAALNTMLFKAGGLFRTRERDNYFNRYLFDPNPSPQILGKDWNTFAEVQWQLVNPGGSATDELNYKASEKVTAVYGLTQFTIGSLEANTGVRVELTEQGYTLKSPKQFQTADTIQRYTDILPSISLKYKVKSDMNVRFSYYKALSRPSYFEIVPYVIEQDGYNEVGNPKLTRVRADNFDVRWEFFPNSTDQLLVGLFYKNIQDPIEYAVVREGVNNEAVIKPGNYGTAHNTGFELEFSKFFNRFGIKGNYTFTYSTLTSRKALQTRVDPNDATSPLTVRSVDQTRPLQGQAKHIGNLSFLFKDLKKGFESQLSLVYTGERLETISAFLDNDWYAAPILQMDVSIEQRIGKHFEVFVKGINLLNSPFEVFVNKPLYRDANSDNVYPFQPDPATKTLVRKDQYYQSMRAGIRFNF